MCNEQTDLKYKPNLCPDCGEKLGCGFWQNTTHWVMWCPRCDRSKWIKKRHTKPKPKKTCEVIEFNKTQHCKIIIPKAVACYIEIKGSLNHIKVVGDKNIVICDEQVFHTSASKVKEK